MENIFTTKNIVIYFIVINIIGLLAMYIYKQKAKKGKWRISEKTLFIITGLRWWDWYNCWYVFV